ncbi:MAG: hypothetical protein VB859_15325, partial [Planctomycetaceae bacterium]
MLIVSVNDPGPIENPDFGGASEPEFITDPFFNKSYSQFSYTFQFMPGSTTYLDTPVVPVGAFVGPNQVQVDGEFPDGTPVISEVNCAASGGGPYINAVGQTVTISSPGTVMVANPR